MPITVLFTFLLRKLIHLGTGLFLVCFARETGWCYLSFGLLVSFTIFLDLGRNFNSTWNSIFLRFFGGMLKKSERDGNLLGATTLWLGLYLAYIIFPLPTFKIAASVAVLADAAAAIGGKLIPRHHIREYKTLSGSLVFAASCILLFNQYWNIPLLPTLLMSIILTIVELYSIEIVENINIIIGNNLLVYLYLFFRKG
jgi:dolichol kinase